MISVVELKITFLKHKHCVKNVDTMLQLPKNDVLGGRKEVVYGKFVSPISGSFFFFKYTSEHLFRRKNRNCKKI